MSNRPGVMIYFDIRSALNRLELDQIGELFLAILDYAEFGDVPDLDPVVGMCFDMLKPKIDRDAERYQDRSTKNRWVRYCGVEKAAGRDPLPFEEWLTSVDER